MKQYCRWVRYRPYLPESEEIGKGPEFWRCILSWVLPPSKGPCLRLMIDLEGPLSWFGTFAYRGSLHRRKSAAWHRFDMVWLFCSPIPVGGGGILLVQMVSTCRRGLRGGSDIWSGLFIPDPDPDFLPIPDPGSRCQKRHRMPDPQHWQEVGLTSDVNLMTLTSRFWPTLWHLSSACNTTKKVDRATVNARKSTCKSRVLEMDQKP